MDRPDRTRAAASGLAQVAAAVVVFYLALLVWLSAIALLPVLLGWTPYVVTSGSMAPRIPAGTVVVAAPPPAEPVAPGGVIVFDDPLAGAVTHRVLAVEDGRYRTKGDANAIADTTPVEPERVRGVGRIVVPLIGLPVSWAVQGRSHLTLLAVATTLVATWLGARMTRSPGGPTAAPRPRDRAGPRGRLPVAAGVVGLLTLGVASPHAAGATFAAAAEQPQNRWVAAPAFDEDPVAGASASDLPRATASTSQTFTFTLHEALPGGATVVIDLTVPYRGPVDYRAAAQPTTSIGTAALELLRGNSTQREARILWRPPAAGLAAGETVTITLPSGIATADVETTGLPVTFTRSDTGAALQAAFSVS